MGDTEVVENDDKGIKVCDSSLYGKRNSLKRTCLEI